MDVFLSTLNQMGFLALLIVIGFVLVKVKIMPDSGAGILSKLENNVFIPALVMGTFMTKFTAESFQVSGQYLLCGLVVTLLGIPVAILLGRLLSKDRYTANIYTYGLAFSNFGFMGNAVVQALYPEEFMNYLIFVLPFWAGIYVWGVPFLLMPAEGKKRSFWDWVKPFVNPMFISMLIGIALGLLVSPLSAFLSKVAGTLGMDVTFTTVLPAFFTDAVNTLGSCMSPVAMLLTGMTIAKIDFKKTFKNVPLYVASVIRLVIIPLIATGVVVLIGLPYGLALCVVCNLAMPLGLSPIVIPAAYGKDTTAAAGMVLISHLLSCITIPAVFMLFNMVMPK